MRKSRFFRRLGKWILLIFLLMNLVAFLHAYSFTHFSTTKKSKTNADKLSATEKIKAVFLGIDNPRPAGHSTPALPYKTVKLQSNKLIECWLINADNSKGTIILFHGYGGEKSSLLGLARNFQEWGYNTLLVDFMGSGGSEGNQTTIGYKESAQVKTCYDYIRSLGEQNIYLFGTSMGAVAIMKAIQESSLQPSGILLECPFGSLYQTTKARFSKMGIPSFPMAGLLVFWGGIQNGFWGFSLRPVDYAKAISCRVLLFYGEKDEKVSRRETDEIFVNLKGPKKLVTFTLAAHESYLKMYEKEWKEEVARFLSASE